MIFESHQPSAKMPDFSIVNQVVWRSSDLPNVYFPIALIEHDKMETFKLDGMQKNHGVPVYGRPCYASFDNDRVHLWPVPDVGGTLQVYYCPPAQIA